MQYGKEYENVESMKETHQKIPEHLKTVVEPPERLLLIWHIFWELNLERDYFATGTSRRIKPSVIENKLKYYGFNTIQIEELKTIIFQMDVEFCDWDDARLRTAREKLKRDAK